MKLKLELDEFQVEALMDNLKISREDFYSIRDRVVTETAVPSHHYPLNILRARKALGLSMDEESCTENYETKAP